MNVWLKLDKNEWILEIECEYSTNMSFSQCFSPNYSIHPFQLEMVPLQ